MSRTFALLSLAALLLAGVRPAQADEPLTLRYKHAGGDTLIYRSETGLKQTQTIGEMKIETELTQTDVSQRTLSETTEEGNLRLQTENKRLKVAGKIGPVGEYKFDSTATDNESASLLGQSLTPLYERLSGAILNVTITPRGEVVKVEGYSELLADVLKDNPIAAQFAGGGSDKAVAAAFAEQFPVLSEKPVSPGDTWQVEYELDLPNLGKAKGKKIYKYEGMDKVGERATAKIDVTHEMAFDLDLNIGGNAATGRFSTEKSSGKIHFDPQRGQVVSAEAGYTLSGDITVNANGQMITVGTSQVQTVKTELLEKIPE